MKYLLIFVVIVAFKFFSNLYRYLRVVKLQKEYWKYIFYISGGNSYSGDVNQRHNEIVSLLKKADVQDSYFGMAEPIGWGQIQTKSVSIFSNMFLNLANIASIMDSDFNTAKGEYHHRMIESFNPLYWIELVIFLPKNIVQYLGLKSDSIGTKIFQFIYWVASCFYLIYRNEINQLVRSFFDSLLR